MQELDLATLPVAGALSCDRTPTGVVLARLPHHARRQIVDPGFSYVVRTPAGVRLDLHTDARELELDALLTFLQIGEDAVPPATFDLVVDAEPTACPSVEDSPGPTLRGPDGRFGTVPRPAELALGVLTLRRVRELITQVVTDRQRDGDEHLHLLDGLSLFGPDDVGDLPDGLHPNEAGYRRIAERFSALVTGPGGPFPVS